MRMIVVYGLHKQPLSLGNVRHFRPTLINSLFSLIYVMVSVMACWLECLVKIP